MRKLLSTLAIVGVIVGSTSVANAQNYTDSAEIQEYAREYVELLQSIDAVVGYPDGEFKPAQNLTREEYATSLVKSLLFLEESLLDIIDTQDYTLYNEILELQKTVYSLLAQVDELTAKEVAEKNNFIGLSVHYVTDRDGDTVDVAVEINGKLQIVKISNKFAISIRPFVNTATELGASLTADLDITDKLEVFAGIGAAGRLDTDVAGTITGYGETGVVPYGHAGVSYDITKDVALTIDGKIPFDSKEGKEPTVGLGINWKF